MFSNKELLPIYFIQFLSIYVYGQNLYCQKEVWHPANENPPLSDGCEEYDGSLIPDCKYFLSNVTSYFHVHEYGMHLVKNSNGRVQKKEIK